MKQIYYYLPVILLGLIVCVGGVTWCFDSNRKEITCPKDRNLTCFVDDNGNGGCSNDPDTSHVSYPVFTDFILFKNKFYRFVRKRKSVTV